MTVYIVFGLVMLGVVVVSLLVTGNLAATFNERAKSDLKNALTPLADLLDGDVDVDEATVSGKFNGQITVGKVVSGPGGMGRLFQTTFVEPAGGSRWSAVVTRPKTDDQDWERTFEGASTPIREFVFAELDSLLAFPGWFEVIYDPEAGAFRLTRAMQSRRDIPTLERFTLYLQTLERIASENRRVQDQVVPEAT
jgi:hypothetical protein